MARENATTIEHSGRVAIKEENEKISLEGIMPSLIGTSKKQLLSLINDTQYKITIHGDGYVYKQSPDAGNSLNKGDRIELYLK